MIYAHVSGELAKQAVSKTAANGQPYAIATVKANNGTDTYAVTVFAFNEMAEEILAMHPGEPLTAVGKAKPTSWETKDGELRLGMTITASALLGKIKKSTRPKPRHQPPSEEDFDKAMGDLETLWGKPKEGKR